MKFKRPHFRIGFTLIELLLFISIGAIVSVELVPLLLTGSDARISQKSELILNTEAAQLTQAIQFAVRDSRWIITPLPKSSGIILTIQDETGIASQKAFSILNGALIVTQNGVSKTMSSPQVSVSGFKVTNTSVSLEKQSIVFSFSLTRTVPLENGQSLHRDVTAAATIYSEGSLPPSTPPPAATPPPTPPSVCGNGNQEGSEECDSGSLNGQICDSVLSGSCVYCDSDCTIKVMPPLVCGNGFKEGSEECDWGVNNGQLCYAPSSTTCTYCNNSCIFITISATTNSLTPPDTIAPTNVCGNGILEPSRGEICEHSGESICPNGYICSSDCLSCIDLTPNQVCGNGIVEGNEVCDTGSCPLTGQYCGNNCQSCILNSSIPSCDSTPAPYGQGTYSCVSESTCSGTFNVVIPLSCSSGQECCWARPLPGACCRPAGMYPISTYFPARCDIRLSSKSCTSIGGSWYGEGTTCEVEGAYCVPVMP